MWVPKQDYHVVRIRHFENRTVTRLHSLRQARSRSSKVPYALAASSLTISSAPGHAGSRGGTGSGYCSGSTGDVDDRTRQIERDEVGAKAPEFRAPADAVGRAVG